jgi:hypothetical protein
LLSDWLCNTGGGLFLTLVDRVAEKLERIGA